MTPYLPADATLIPFTKMHGLGNDYIYIWCPQGEPADVAALAVDMSERHTGVGSDGLILITPSSVADFRMRMFNADGSEGRMCGNASRCIAKFVYDNGLTQKRIITLETLAGIKILTLDLGRDGKVEAVTVDMGQPEVDCDKIPVSAATRQFIGETVITSQGPMKLTAVSMGNPHAVTFVSDPAAAPVHTVGPELENATLFPEKANIEFVHVIDRSHLAMRVWERGSGETQACGTGACAALVAAVLGGFADREASVTLPGGTLEIEWGDDGHVYMRGPATEVFSGVYHRQ